VVTIGFVLKEENGVRNLLKGWKKWKLNPFWYLVGFSPVIMVLITIIIYLLLGGTLSFSETSINWGFIIFMVIIALFTGATGEELGWRGFLQPQLQTRFNWLISSVIVGLCWGLWHLPLWLTGLWSDTNLGLYLIRTIAFSIIIGWAYNKTNQSVFIASMFHYFANISVLVFTPGGLELITTEVYETLSPIIYSLYAIAVVIFSELINKRSSKEHPILD
ncbi:MAG: lysostaphin resistance A-like protein, partial [Candidatus Hermodarchaeota archaeon]